ncbi:MAG TPA: ATP-dependent RNA helicase HrpA [Micromonospora sp.]
MRTPSPTPTIAELESRLAEVMLRDERRLQRRLDGARRIRDVTRRDDALRDIAAEITAAAERVARRRATVPAITYPAALPVTEKKDEILAAIRDHQVVVVAGETGSGKTTQLPKICLELGRGVRGMIGHTQPRRIAARTVAQRIAEELGVEFGSVVGYKVRFTDQVSDTTLVKLMTDGILLAEIQHDRMLRQYDTLIIDEAHERSLNIDFILGYLKQLLPRRPDLKVIITSATIDPHRFARHFAPPGQEEAPVVEVSGRTYPVEVRYRPLVQEAEPEKDEDGEVIIRDQTQAICDAVEELCAEGPGDILVFLSGEREIRDTADALSKLNLPNTEILPLYARLSAAEQQRVFTPHTGRRIVLATNVAETSLTVPGIRYVVDPGTARISRYSHRLKVQRLPIEPISQASANQRKGRCGRTAPGICIRLYDEKDFLSRPEFTEPEILRTNLASVILQMTALGLGDIASFPFIDPPDRRRIKDGIELLHELGAIDPTQTDPRKRLTPLGRKLAQLPIDPRLGRMVLEAERNGALDEVMVIAAALSIQDPRERPADKQQAADQAHARFVDPDSDFLTYVNLWRYLHERQRELSSSGFRRMCKAEFLNYLRVREWQDIYSQLRQVMRSLGAPVTAAKPADPAAIHQSLLAGLLSHVGLKDSTKNEYVGARGAKFAIFPGSALAKKPPRWIMAAELVETSRLWARIVARIEPEWIEPLAGHLVKRTYSEPHWSRKQGAVLAYERVTLYGVPVVTRRRVNYGRIDPELSRELFIRHALVDGDWETHHRFWHENQRLRHEIEELERRTRRRDILVDDETIFTFYDERVGREVVSARHFDAWWKKVQREQPDLLTFTRELLVNPNCGAIDEDAYPDEWPHGELRLPLSYEFDPGSPTDGVTVDIPLPMLNRVSPAEFEWQVPGLREELVIALLRSLPKALRRNFVPIPDYARAVLARITPGPEPLVEALTRELRRMTGVTIPHDAWDLSRIPEYLRPNFRVVDDDNRPIAEGRDLAELQRQLHAQVRRSVAAAAHGLERRGITDWDFGELPRTVQQNRGGYTVTAYPALVDEGDSVAIRVFDSEVDQRNAMWAGCRRLLRLTTASPVKFMQGRLSNEAKLTLSRGPYRNAVELLEDCADAAVDKLMADAGGPVWDAASFAALRDRVRAELVDTVIDVVERVRRVLAAASSVEQRLARMSAPALEPALADIRHQLAGLIYPGFIAETGWARLPDLVRYLTAIERRLDKLPVNPQRDRAQLARIEQVQREYHDLLAALPPARRTEQPVREIRWLIEELRVNLFAQALGTPYPVSEQRIYRAMDLVEAGV